MLRYVRLPNSDNLPDVRDLKPYKAVVVIEAPVSGEMEDTISRWLVDSGCLYMMAWGLECNSFEISVDMANIKSFDFGEIPDDSFVRTTSHENEPLEELFWFAKNAAFHPTKELENTLLVHLSGTDKGQELIEKYNNAN